jgi:protein-disulfide isomerase
MIDQSATLTLPVGPRDHAQGPDDAPATLVEYGDYECPSCGSAYPMIKQVQQQMGDQLRFVYRNFPLREIHPYAENAAEAAEAAGAQGAFWPMHDTLFEHQQALDDQDLVNYAAGLDLDVDRFTQALEDHVYADRVREDFMSGIRSGVNGTPTFFINGARYDGSFTVDSLVAALTEAAGER